MVASPLVGYANPKAERPCSLPLLAARIVQFRFSHVVMTHTNRPFWQSRLPLMALAGMAVLGLTLTGCASGPTGANSEATAPLAADAPYEARLANHLAEQDAAMYGAFWCPHCSDQKELFGDAIDRVPYVECDPEGENAQPDLCTAKEIKGYPTWEIDGEFYPGTRSLEELAQLSGFEAE